MHSMSSAEARPFTGNSGALNAIYQTAANYKKIKKIVGSSLAVCVGTLGVHERSLVELAAHNGVPTVFIQPSFMWPVAGREARSSPRLRRLLGWLAATLRIPGAAGRADGLPLKHVTMAVGLGRSGRAVADRMGFTGNYICLLYTSPSPRDRQKSRMPSSA